MKEKNYDLPKVIQFFDKFLRKMQKHQNMENLFLQIDLLFDRKETKNKIPKPSLFKQQEELIKKDSEKNVKVNLKPITMIKEIISSPIIEDPIYEEYLKWKEENKLDKMIEIIRKKAQYLQNFESSGKTQKTLSKTHTAKFPYFHTLNQTEKTEESSNPRRFEEQREFVQARVNTTDGQFRKKMEIEKIIRYPKFKHYENSEDEINFEDLILGPETEKNQEMIENFSKKKYFYKYPFRPINYKFKEDKTNKTEDITELFFEKLYLKLVKQHEKCGDNCGHLKKFYQRISFVNKYIQKEEMHLNKNIIDRIPYLNNKTEEDFNFDLF